MSEDSWSLPALPSRGIRALLVGAFVVLCLAVYGAALGNDFVRLDDGLLIFENPITRGLTPSNIAAAFTRYDPELYIPLTFLSYQLDFTIGGANPFVYHMHMLVVHALNAALVAWLVFLLSSSGRAGLLAGALWAVHPLNTEAVAWASALKDVQATFFFLAALIAYLGYRESGSRARYWLSVALFTLGLLSKVLVLTLPAVLLLLEWRSSRAPWSKRVLLDVTPFAALSILFGLIAIGGKTEVIASATILETMLMAAKSTIFYLGKLVWPIHLSVLYPYDGAISITSPDFFLPVLGVALLIAGAVALRRFSRHVPFAVAFYLITLIPTFLNFSKIDTFFVASDRYAYIPSIAFFFLVAVGIDALLSLPGRHATMRQRSVGIGVACITAVVLLSTTAHARSLVWRDTESLFQNVLTRYPQSFIARNNLGNVYYRQGRWDDAIREFTEGLRYGKQTVLLQNNLARAYGKKGMVADAVQHFESSIALEPTNQETYVELARMYAENGRTDDALAAYATAIELKPTYAITYVNRASLLLNTGQIDEAFADLDTAIDLDDTVPQAHYNLGLAHAQRGDIDAAIAAYERAVALEPRFYEAHFNLGVLYAKVGRLLDARAELVTAQRIKPGNRTIDGALQQIDDALAEQ